MEMSYPFLLRLLTVFCGLATLFSGFFSFLTAWSDFPAAFILNLYIMVFALLIILAEFRLRFMLKSFVFLQTYMGRGMFYIFVGTICFVYVSTSSLVMGIILIANGLVQLWFVLINHDEYKKEKQQLKEKGYVSSELGAVASSELKKKAAGELVASV